jgi:hypothetical protein
MLLLLLVVVVLLDRPVRPVRVALLVRVVQLVVLR